MEPINRIIKELREDHDLSQEEVGKKIGKLQSHYSRYETGEYEVPLSVALILADLYEVSMDYLTGRTYDRFGTEGIKEIGKNLISDYSYKQLLIDAAALPTEKKKQLKDYLQFLKKV